MPEGKQLLLQRTQYLTIITTKLRNVLMTLSSIRKLKRRTCFPKHRSASPSVVNYRDWYTTAIGLTNPTTSKGCWQTIHPW